MQPSTNSAHQLTRSLTFLVALLLAQTSAIGDLAAQCTGPLFANRIVEENCKTSAADGVQPQSQWDVVNPNPGDVLRAGDPAIQGFATDISVNHGDTISFKVLASVDYHIDIYRLGYYGGNGARRVATIQNLHANSQTQAACTSVDTSTFRARNVLLDCGTWSVSATWNVPGTAVSGLYIARLVRDDSTVGASHIPFIVRDDASHSNILFKTSDTTWAAYNNFGGWSL